MHSAKLEEKKPRLLTTKMFWTFCELLNVRKSSFEVFLAFFRIWHRDFMYLNFSRKTICKKFKKLIDFHLIRDGNFIRLDMQQWNYLIAHLEIYPSLNLIKCMCQSDILNLQHGIVTPILNPLNLFHANLQSGDKFFLCGRRQVCLIVGNETYTKSAFVKASNHNDH